MQHIAPKITILCILCNGRYFAPRTDRMYKTTIRNNWWRLLKEIKLLQEQIIE